MFLQSCLTVWLILPLVGEQRKAACNCPLGACHSMGICNHFEKRDLPHHWRRQAGTSAQNIPLKIAFNVALRTICGSGKMWCKGRLQSCIVAVTQNQRLYHFIKISTCVKTHQDNLTGPQASLHMVAFEKSGRASSSVHVH